MVDNYALSSAAGNSATDCEKYTRYCNVTTTQGCSWSPAGK